MQRLDVTMVSMESRRSGHACRPFAISKFAETQFHLNFTQVNPSNATHLAQDRQIKLSNKAALIKHESRLSYHIACFLPQMFSETYFSATFSCNTRKIVNQLAFFPASQSTKTKTKQ